MVIKLGISKNVWFYTANDHLKLTARAGYFFREREKSQTSKDRYRDFSGGVKGNYVLDKDKDLGNSLFFRPV